MNRVGPSGKLLCLYHAKTFDALHVNICFDYWADTVEFNVSKFCRLYNSPFFLPVRPTCRPDASGSDLWVCTCRTSGRPHQTCRSPSWRPSSPDRKSKSSWVWLVMSFIGFEFLIWFRNTNTAQVSMRYAFIKLINLILNWALYRHT